MGMLNLYAMSKNDPDVKEFGAKETIVPTIKAFDADNIMTQLIHVDSKVFWNVESTDNSSVIQGSDGKLDYIEVTNARLTNKRSITEEMIRNIDVSGLVLLVDNFGPLVWAARRRKNALFDDLIGMYDRNMGGEIGSNHLSYFSKNGDFTIVEYLLKRNDYNQETLNEALVVSVLSGYAKTTQMLLSFGANINVITNDIINTIRDKEYVSTYRIIKNMKK